MVLCNVGMLLCYVDMLSCYVDMLINFSITNIITAAANAAKMAVDSHFLYTEQSSMWEFGLYIR